MAWQRATWMSNFGTGGLGGLRNMNLNSQEVKEINEIECEEDMHRRHRIS